MSLFVNTNVSSLNAQRQLFDSGSRLSNAFEQLSSGFRINRAADDAAGLQISDRLTSQVQGLNQSVRNANDAISLVQTAEGALSETTTNLQRLRQLSIQAQNGIYSEADKDALQKETNQLLTEINRISETTQFAGNNLLDGAFSTVFQVGANAGQQIGVSLTQFSGAGFGVNGLGVTGLDVTEGAAAAGIAPASVSGATAFSSNDIIYDFDGSTGTAVPTTGTYRFAISNDGGASYSEISVDLTAGGSPAIADANGDAFVTAVNDALGENVLDPPPTVAFVDVNGAQPSFRIAAESSNPGTLTEEANSGTVGTYTSSGGSGTAATNAIDGALSRIGSVRAELGAIQNRFQSTIRNLSNISENLSASRSQIRDTDFASATAELTKNQIIQQASSSILAQANQRPQAALSLLG